MDNQQNLIGSKLLTNYVVKNSRRLFAWNRKHQQNNTTSIQLNTTSIQAISNINNRFESAARNRLGVRVEETLTNLIAAKLLSENIDLAKLPYTDEARRSIIYTTTIHIVYILYISNNIYCTLKK